MEIRSLPADETAVRRYVEELWLPYHRDLETAVERHALADDVDLVAEEVEFRLDRLAAESYRTWVAVDNSRDEDLTVDSCLADCDGELAGFITTDIDESPPVFDRPDRLLVGDIYVRGPYRGSGLAQALIDRAATRARAEECTELTLIVDVNNERASTFYDKLGFTTYRRQLVVDVDEV